MNTVKRFTLTTALLASLTLLGGAFAKDLAYNATFVDAKGDIISTVSITTGNIASDLGDLEDARFVTLNIDGTQARFHVLQAGEDVMASSVRLDLADNASMSLTDVTRDISNASYGVAIFSDGSLEHGTVTQVVPFNANMMASIAPQNASHLTLIIGGQVTTYDIQALGAGNLRSVIVDTPNGNSSLLAAML
jgi:hypothetical protein